MTVPVLICGRSLSDLCGSRSAVPGTDSEWAPAARHPRAARQLHTNSSTKCPSRSVRTPDLSAFAPVTRILATSRHQPECSVARCRRLPENIKNNCRGFPNRLEFQFRCSLHWLVCLSLTTQLHRCHWNGITFGLLRWLVSTVTFIRHTRCR